MKGKRYVRLRPLCRGGEERGCGCKQVFSIRSGGPAADFEVVYHGDTKDYSMALETSFWFDTQESVKNYLENILTLFTAWMRANGFCTDRAVSLWRVFTRGDGMCSRYRSLEEAYAVFKLLVSGAWMIELDRESC